MRTTSQKIIAFLLNNKWGREYFGVPKGKKIFKIERGAVHYLKGEIHTNGLPIICMGQNVEGVNPFTKWLETWKPIHLCWFFIKMGWKIPKYFIGASPQNLQVGASSDDGNCTTAGTIALTGTSLRMGSQSTTHYNIIVRFLNVGIPVGATIVTAKASFYAVSGGTYNPTTTNNRIQAFDEDNTETFSTGANLNGRAVTTAYVDWISGDWTANANTWRDTPEIKTVIQEVIDLAGWALNNALGLKVNYYQQTGDSKYAKSWDGDNSLAPKLYVEYTGGASAPTVTTQAVSDIAKTTGTGNGNITSTGGANATRRGFCYLEGASGDPTVADSVVYDDGDFGTGAYTKSVTGLTAETAYRARAYAVNSVGTSYGSTVDVTTGVASNIKTYNTNPIANIKTINTNPIANVKTLNTNA